MLGIDAWVVFGVLLVGGYTYWVYTDLIRPRFADDADDEWRFEE